VESTDGLSGNLGAILTMIPETLALAETLVRYGAPKIP
jgi:hypothetical protein